MKITVCIGSSCHLKGSRQVVEQLQKLVADHNMCQTGVNVTVDGEAFSVSPETVETFFNETVLPRLKK